MKRLFIIALFFLPGFYLCAQEQMIKAFECLDKKGEVYFTFEMDNAESVADLTRIVSIDNIKDNQVFAYANLKEFLKFLSFKIDYTVLEHPGDRIKNPAMYDGSKGIWDFDTYPTYTEYETMMYSFQTNYPGICKIVQVGTSVDGRKLLYAKISDNVNTREAEPRFMYSSSMHGDETTGYVLMLRLINYLLENYGGDAEVNNLVNNMEIWIMPLENPDGTYAGGNTTVAGATRYNANNVDLNRNYPNFVEGDHPDGEAWQPEALALMGFTDTVHFVLSANFHGGTEVVNYPWDTKAGLHADDAWWYYVSRNYADVVHNYGPADYFEGYDDGITNGYAWYQALGSRQDYMTYNRYGREFTLEISDVKTVDASELQNHWNYNYRSLLAYIKEGLFGLNGIVTDSITHEPLEAMVYIDGHDLDNSHVYSELPHGDYYRMLNEGNYDVTYSCPGYRSKTISVNITNGIETILDVELANLSMVPPYANFNASETNLSCSGEVSFNNLSETYGTTTYLWNFGDGTTSGEISPVHVYTTNGNYTVSLTVSNINGSNTKTRISYINVNLPVITEVNSAAVCESSGSMTVSAYGTGTIYWFDVPVGGTSFHTGNTYTTPVITSTATYYVEDHVLPETGYVGKTDNAGSGSYYNNNSEWGLIFDCLEACLLKSVKVYTGSAGERTISIYNSSGTLVNEATVNIPEGESRVTLNFSLDAGTNYEITCSANPDMYRNDGGVPVYPYVLPGKISINKSNLPEFYGPENFYYFFYDWEISGDECVSERVPVYAVINEIPVAHATYTNAGYQVQMQNTTENGVTWLWNFGDGSTSTDYEPIHDYPESIIYHAYLIAYNDCGSDTFYFDLDLTTAGFEFSEKNSLFVYPNPLTDILNIGFNENNLKTIRIFDIYGNLTFMDIRNEKMVSIDLSSLASGVYILTVQDESGILRKQIIKE
ncbi:MAG: hypothetical protein A2W91_15610 [Bacteroidetes bacterium GWF2_38_335]|nr:MAG: hypothetical protein A2W91_15610 [Bacteroidetes bacterium GWF2_38_335]OFY81519.1 MAG: hypothetical protein A2281_11470 [Bacteroidetes bacterium RIFOXYA12_FULL_38_20]HBS87689.1 hypothetical protein [Bacteroidales bacterium]